MFALKKNLNEYFMYQEGKSYGISIIGAGRIVVSVGTVYPFNLSWNLELVKFNKRQS